MRTPRIRSLTLELDKWMGREQTSLTSVSMLGRDRDVSPERTPLLSGRRIEDPLLPLPGPPLPGPPPGPAAPLLPFRGVGPGILKDAGETPEDFILPPARLAAQVGLCPLRVGVEGVLAPSAPTLHNSFCTTSRAARE